MDQDQIKRLASFDSRGACVLSAYLNLAPQHQVQRTYQTVLKDLAHELRERLDEPRRAALEAEGARVAEWLDAQPSDGVGLAIFACTPAGLWETFHLHVPVRNRLVFEATPYVGPLLDLLDEYERYAVALVDKERESVSSASFSVRSRSTTTSRTSYPANTIRVACRRPTFSATTRRTSSGTSSAWPST